MIKLPQSIAHKHLLSIINTEIHDRSVFFKKGLRVLDLGCGNGELILYLMENLPILNPSITLDIYGLEVDDHGSTRSESISELRPNLAKRLSSKQLADRIAVLSTSDPWPYPDEFFDIIISNQVLEHVDDHDFLFSEVHRTLRWGGSSVHLFPLKHYIREAHLGLPFVHRINNHDLLCFVINLFYSLGLGKYPSPGVISMQEYVENKAAFLLHSTNYLSYREFVGLAKRHHLRVSSRYTKEFYTSKVRSLLKIKPTYSYAAKRSILMDWTAIIILRYISSVTLFLEKEDT